MDRTPTNQQQSAVGRGVPLPNSPNPVPHGRGRGRAVDPVQPLGVQQTYGSPVAPGHRSQQGFDHSRVQVQQPQRLLSQDSGSSETAGPKQLPFPIHRVTISADKDRLCREWHGYTRAMRAQQPHLHGHVSPTAIDHSKQLDAWLDRVDRQPLQVKQELDALLPTDGYGSFRDREKHKVRTVEYRCFAALNPGHDLASVLGDIPSERLKFLSEEQLARAAEAARRLAGWLLHFREVGRQRLATYYLESTIGPYKGFREYTDSLFQLAASKESHPQLEQNVGAIPLLQGRVKPVRFDGA